MPFICHPERSEGISWQKVLLKKLDLFVTLNEVKGLIILRRKKRGDR